MQHIRGQIVDLHKRRIFSGEVSIEAGKIQSIKAVAEAPDQYILPGFIDAHIHIESSMLVPYEFARIALQHGTVATISDPHEIANVLGVDGGARRRGRDPRRVPARRATHAVLGR